MPDLLVEQHIQVAHAQGAHTYLRRDMPVIRDGGDTLGAGIRHQGATQRQDRQALALAGHALVVWQPGFGDREGNTLADGHERSSCWTGPCRPLNTNGESLSREALGFLKACRKRL
ncbi:hypothetical protein D3C75_821640 [compost metagenome]